MSSDEGMSFEMEKVLSAMPEGNPYGMKATRILEINPKHPIFAALQKVYAKDKEAVKEYADVLYTQAMLIEGFPVEDPWNIHVRYVTSWSKLHNKTKLFGYRSMPDRIRIVFLSFRHFLQWFSS